MNNKLVSIVIPVYNSERFLEECLNSILEQTYQNIEIIAIDDGSNDSSLDILNNFSNKIHIFSQKNQGLAISLNLGISKIKGDWLKWFSPDDIMYPNTIEILVNEAENHDNNTKFYRF
jgi:glycosyltransferase involved in cell wall biosynthesis